MRLGKRCKLNIILAILLCMAFAIDIGVTFAASAYSFLADSGVSSTYVEGQTYIECAEVVSESGGQVAYNIGSMAHNMDVSYGFTANHDLMLQMTISYNNTEHALNDFTLNFVDRSKWSIDTPTSFENITNNATKETHYSLTSTSNTMTISMYYIGVLSGSGVLPVISGVTFYNDYLGRTATDLTVEDYSGDYLTIEITPYYSKSLAAGKYSSAGHTFNSHAVGNKAAFTNWVSYKNGTMNNKYMVYNAHGQDETGILFPQDFAYPGDTSDLSSIAIIDDSMTAYEYQINSSASDDIEYSKLLAGNKYSGGVGVFVYPSTSTSVKINIVALWELNGAVTSSIANPIHLEPSSEVDENFYYKATVSQPTYINVLEYIRLTAQGPYEDMWEYGYKLVISSVTLTFDNTSVSGLEEDYKINNSTAYSPILARYRSGETSRNINVSLTNQNANPIKINSFTIKAKLWYVINDDPLNYSESASYITTSAPFKYDSNLWGQPNLIGNEYTFNAAGSPYISYGYEMQLIEGVVIPAQTYGQGSYPVTVRDLWCAIEIVSIDYDEITSYGAQSEYANIEVSAPNQYVPIENGGSGYITIKNNSKQIITSATIALTLLATDSGLSFNYDLISAVDYNTTALDNANSSTETEYTFANLNVYPNERVVLCKIIPTAKCVIDTISIKVNLATTSVPNVSVSRRIEQTAISYSHSYMINDSTSAYQVRIKSSQSLQNILSADDFVFSADGKYAYYIGVLYPKQLIDLGSKLTNNVNYEVDTFAHNLNQAPTFTNWSTTNDTQVAEWQAKMNEIFNILDAEDIKEQIKNA